MTPIILALLLLAGAPDPATAGFAEAQLLDQRGRPDSIAAHRGGPLVLLVADVRRLRPLKGLEVDLRKRFPKLEFVRVADVPATPPTTYEKVVSRLRGRVPEEVGILIDMERTVARGLCLDTAEPNVVLLDAQGDVTQRFRGTVDAAFLARVSVGVELLLQRPAGASKP